MDSLPSTSKIFPEDVKHSLSWYQHSEIEMEHSESSDKLDVTMFPSQNPEQCQSHKLQLEQKEPFDLSITNLDQEYTIKSKLEDQNQKFVERNPHQGHYAKLVTPPSNSTSGEALWIDQKAHTPMTVWSSQNKLPLSATSFLQPQPSLPYDSATAVIPTSKQIPNIIQGAVRSSANIQNHSLFQPSKLQPASAETALDTPLCFPSPSSSNTSPFGVSPSSYVNTDGISKNDSELAVTGDDDPTMETECTEMLKSNSGKETNSREFYKGSSSFVTSAGIDQQFTNSSCEGYMVPHMDSLPSTSKGYSEDVIHDLSWNLHSESVRNYHSTSFGRPEDNRVFQSVNPKQYQHELAEPFDIPAIDLDQEKTNEYKLDEDQNQKFTERNPHQGHYAQLVTPPSNSTSGEALWVDQNAHTPMTAWSSQNKLPLSATSLHDSMPSLKEIPSTIQGAQRSSTNVQNHFLFQPGKPQCETELETCICFPSPSPVPTAEDQMNTSPYGILPSSYVNTDGISKNDGGCTVTGAYDASGKTSTRQELNREESEEMQNINNGKEKKYSHSPEFSVDSSSFGTSAMTDPQYTNSSRESYEVPNIDSLASASKGFLEDVKDSETDNAGRLDVTEFPLINPEQYQINKPQFEQTEPFDLSINDLDQEGRNKNKFDGDQNLKLSEKDYHQDQLAQLATLPSNSTSGEAFELDQSSHTPMTAWSSQNKLPLTAASLLQLQPSSPYDSAATVISSKEIPETIQGNEGISTNIQSHSLSQPNELQPAPTGAALGTPISFPSPSSATEDQMNTSPFGVSPSSYVNTDGIINKDGGLKVTVDNDTSIDANTREESCREEYNEMQRVIMGEERSDSYSTTFNTNSSATSAVDQYFIKSSKDYVPNISSLPSISKEVEHNLVLHQNPESIENDHATNKNQHEDQNLKFSERAPNQDQNTQLVTPLSSSTSSEALGEVPGLAQSSSNSLLEPQPSSLYDSAPTVITSSEEIPNTVQGDEGSSTNLQSHSLSQPSQLQPAPIGAALGTPISFPSPSSATEDQMNTSLFGVSPSSYANTDGIINKDGGLKLTVDNDTSIDANSKEESSRKEYNEMQRVIRGEERSDTYSTTFNTNSSATSAIDQCFIKSSEGYVPNISSLPSPSKEFPKEVEHNLLLHQHPESIKNDHATNKNQLEEDQNLKFSERAPNQSQNTQLVTPLSSSTSSEALGEVPGLAQNSSNSLLEPQPSSLYDSAPTVITSSKEKTNTVQGDEGSNTNLQSHSLSQPSQLQPAPTGAALGTPISFPSPSSVSTTEDQTNTSPFGVSPSSYVNTDGIINKDGGLKVTVDNDTSIDANTREEYNEMQRVIRGEEKSDTYSTTFNTNSSSVTSAIDQCFIKSSEGYVPNISSLPSPSREFPKEIEHNLLLPQHSESIKNDHATNKNQLEEDQNLKFSERAPHQGQNTQLVTPLSSSTSSEALGEVPGLAQSSSNSLLEPQPSSLYDSAPTVITSSKEIPNTVQGDEGSNTNIQSHSLSQPSQLQPAPTGAALGTPISFPSPSSATEDQMNTSPFGVSPSRYVNTDEISKDDDLADDPSMERSPRQELNREGVLEPIQTKILKYKNGRKRMFMVLQRSSFELMKDKGLIQPVKAFPNGQILPVTKDELECSKTLLPPTHQPEDIEKIQYKSITQLEDLEELPDSLEDIRKLPAPSSYEFKHPLQAPQRSFSPFTLEWSDNSFLTPTIKQTPVVVTWSATSVTDSPALSFTIQLPSKINNSSFTLHSASINSKQSNLLPSGASNHYAFPPFSTEIPSTSSQSWASYTNQPPSLDAQDLSQMHDMFPPSPSAFHEWDEDLNHYSSKGSKVLKISDKGISERQNLIRKNIIWLANKEGTSELMEEDVKQLAENAMNRNKDFEETKLQLKKKYNRLLSKHSQKYNGLLKKYRNLERTYDIVEDAGSREQILRDAKKFLSEEHAMFLESQMFLKNRTKKGNKFSKKFLKYVIGLYERSPAGYRFLRTIFTMPSVRTIHKWQNRSQQNVETGTVNQNTVTEMSGTYGDIESFADMLQMGPMPSGHEQTEMSNAESFQELINVPPTDFYENNDAIFWDDSQVGFEVPQQFVQPQEQVVQSGCEVEYIQNVDDAYMLTQL